MSTDVFPFTVIVVFGDFQAQAAFDEIRALNTAEPIATLRECEDLAAEMDARVSAAGYCWHLSPVTVLLWMANPNDRACMAHETFHAVYWLLSNQGIQLTRETNEVYAYLQQWMVEGIQQGLRVHWDAEELADSLSSS